MTQKIKVGDTVIDLNGDKRVVLLAIGGLVVEKLERDARTLDVAEELAEIGDALYSTNALRGRQIIALSKKLRAMVS